MYTISGSGCRQALCSWIKTIVGCVTDPYADYVVYDTFTDTNGVAIASHTPDKAPVGASWSSYVAGTTIESNKASDNSADRQAVIDSGISDCTITADMVLQGGNFFGVMFRSTDSNHFFIAGCDVAFDYTTVWLNNAGWSQLAQVAHAYSNGDAVSIQVVLNGANIQVTCNGVLDVNINNATLQTATKHGLYSDGSAWGADGTWDDFAVA